MRLAENAAPRGAALTVTIHHGIPHEPVSIGGS